MKNGEIMDRTWLESARRLQGYTQTQVAIAARTSLANYTRLEKGLTTPDVKVGLRICEFLKLNPKMFLLEKAVQ